MVDILKLAKAKSSRRPCELGLGACGVCRHPARLRRCSTDYLIFCSRIFNMFYSITVYDIFPYLGLDSNGSEWDGKGRVPRY
jgi:hypothetical protein